METGFGVATSLGPEFSMLGPQLNMVKAAIEGLIIPGFERYGPHPILSKIYLNEEFQAEFIDWFVDRFTQEFHPDSMNLLLDQMAEEIQPYMEEYKHRWPFISDVNTQWPNSILNIKDFNRQRPDYMRKHLLEYFDTEKIIPLEYKLHQNYPNPFNAVTTIKYQIPRATTITINIYNILGQKVASFLKKYDSGGHFTLDWNAGNHATGLYYYSIENDEFRDIRKMVFIK
jgi:hypothetical protein